MSRGGYKLEHALDEWKIDVAGRVALDAGASAGGFTDCLLQRGASLVYSVDCGYNQLEYSLRYDSRVVVMERTVVQDFVPTAGIPDFAVADLSFRSLSGVVGRMLPMTREGWMIGLLKPQFEDPALADERDGAVDDCRHPDIIRRFRRNLEEASVELLRLVPSPIRGKRKGNREYLVLLRQLSAR